VPLRAPLRNLRILSEEAQSFAQIAHPSGL
jgi:hypothetical protein